MLPVQSGWKKTLLSAVANLGLRTKAVVLLIFCGCSFETGNRRIYCVSVPKLFRDTEAYGF